MSLAQNTSTEKMFAAILSCVPLCVWLISTGDILAYFTSQIPAGQLLYIFSKLAGLYAYYFIAIQIIIGLQGRESRYFCFHPIIGLLVTFTVFLHACLFIAGATLRTKHIPIDILWPTFDNGYYKNSIGYGVIAAYGLLLIVMAGLLQRRYRIFRMIHRFAPVVALMGWIHSFNIGTETRSLVVMGFYSFFFCLAFYIFLQKIKRIIFQN